MKLSIPCIFHSIEFAKRKKFSFLSFFIHFKGRIHVVADAEGINEFGTVCATVANVLLN